ncbi:MAG: acyl-CoA dehydrogenase family protein [Deinococcales bacterium]
MDAMEHQPPSPEALLGRIEALGDRIRAAAPAIDRERHVPEELVDALRGAGLFRIMVPRAWGGWELDPPAIVELSATLARFDASTAWVGMIGATTHALAAFLPEEGMREIYEHGADFLMGGLATPPAGRAETVEDGYRITGRFPFGSASRHCGWFVARCRIEEEGVPPTADPRQDPNTILAFVPADEVTVHDTWHVVGLRGTGSHDYELADTFVPAHRTFRLLTATPVQPGPLYRISRVGLLPAYLGAICVGIGRAAIHAFAAYAAAKRVAGVPLAERPLARARLAEAEAIVASAHAYLLDVTRASWEKLTSGGELDERDRARQLLSATHAAQTCARAVELMYTSSGSAALSTASVLQRLLRDVHAAKQHALVGFGQYETAGGMLLRATA